MISQDENGIKHVSLLRKVILKKQSGTAWFGGDGWDKVITFERGLMPDGTGEHLTHILREPVFRLGWEKSSRHGWQSANAVPARHVFSQVLTDIDMPVKRMIAYRRKLECLPNVRTRYLTTFRSDADYQKHFQNLYLISLGAPGVHLEDYFAAATDISELRKRVNIVIGAYCLGDLVPAVSPSRSRDVAGAHLAASEMGKVNVVSRIMARLRGRLDG
ncbi:MAG TPA: hypothetical protein VKA31_07635 [Mariprofundaceae bacterium]|nr:hypothetical protein [Mariprofundaceae bacterium]